MLLCFATILAFNVWVGEVNEFYHYPDPEGHSITYTVAEIHPNPEDARVVCFINPGLDPQFLVGREIKDVDWAMAEGWFYYPEPTQ